MGLTVTQSNYAEALGLGRNTTVAHMRGLPHVAEKRTKRYPLAAVLPRCTPAQARDLLKLARRDGATFVGGDEALPTARSLEAWILARDDGMAGRLSAIRSTFMVWAAEAFASSAPLRDSERLRQLLPLSGSILPYVLGGSDHELPEDWRAFVRSFVILHAAVPSNHSEAA